MAEAVPAEAAPLEPQARHVIYCGICSLPPEYCEFGGTTKKCREWLEKNHMAMAGRIYSDEALDTSLTTLSLDAQKRADKDAAKKAAKAEAQEAKVASQKASAKVLIKRVERHKRKFVTAIQGLEAHDLDLKKVSRELGKKFATGASVTKIPSGGEEIVVQGDLSDEIEEWLIDVHKEIPEDNIYLIEDKKKKKEGGP